LDLESLSNAARLAGHYCFRVMRSREDASGSGGSSKSLPQTQITAVSDSRPVAGTAPRK
jgi:hypothetical protein